MTQTLGPPTLPDVAHLRDFAREAREQGRTVVVVQGLGFVGSAMAAVTATAESAAGTPAFQVIGVDLPTPDGIAKIERINRGLPVVHAADPSLPELTRKAVEDLGTLIATDDPVAYELADVVVVDLPLDAEFAGDGESISLSMDRFRSALAVVAKRIPADALVLLESTVPPGTTEEVVLPLFREQFESRGIESKPLIAHAYERVMPGPRYVESIRAFWRCFSGVSPEARDRARAFLEVLIDTGSFPLTELTSPRASEMAKVLENSYRAMNIAFIEEWSQAAEDVGVNLFEVIRAIRRRTGTHDNIRQPGFGVGGYCLPKDGLVAEWGLRELLGYDGDLGMTKSALRTNRRMPLHALRLVVEGFPDGLSGRTVGVAGVSYLATVGDTRNSPAEAFVDAVLTRGGAVLASDPLVDAWPERPDVDLVSFRELTARCDAVVLTIGHQAFLNLGPDDFVREGVRIVDAAGVLDDQAFDNLAAAGHSVVGVGRGDRRGDR